MCSLPKMTENITRTNSFPRYLAFLPQFVFLPDAVVARYIARGWLLSLLPSIALALLTYVLFDDGSPPAHRTYSNLVLVIVGVFLAPMLETLVMAPPLLLMSRLFGPGPAVVISAVSWGALHSVTNHPAHGLVVWWGFLVMSIAFITWRPLGLLKSLAVVMAIHALQNSVAVALILS